MGRYASLSIIDLEFSKQRKYFSFALAQRSRREDFADLLIRMSLAVQKGGTIVFKYIRTSTRKLVPADFCFISSVALLFLADFKTSCMNSGNHLFIFARYFTLQLIACTIPRRAVYVCSFGPMSLNHRLQMAGCTCKWYDWKDMKCNA